MIGSADLESTYADLSRTEYSWEELKVRPLPPGVDPAKIETYLSNDVFLVCILHNIFNLKGNFKNTGGLSLSRISVLINFYLS